ncbi:DUF6111 family protein [Limobrevibacterium gyesilva]|uniref:DUF6111 family protein n=1 Tax=Limobrevibacterium gyesilva TaxID=2991712 RepID=A0AA42CK61_9PROT|nr:DUF6111 family protein [Limobrevibacterium gyesilva]MCW3477587.1 DUF6111 family protein [Limobrevibacterium gyesilva]
MLRFTELGLFLVPFALFVTWRIMGPRTPPRLVWAAAVAVLVMAAGTMWYGLNRRIDRSEAYEPAHLEDGRIVPGHGVPKVPHDPPR